MARKKDSHDTAVAQRQAGLIPYKPGQSGNPGGRHALPEEFKAHGPAALRGLVKFMKHKTPSIALRATEIVVERIYGKPTQPLEHTGDLLDLVAERVALYLNGHSEPAGKN